MLSNFSWVFYTFVCLLWRSVYFCLCPFFDCVFFFGATWTCILEINSLSVSLFANILSHSEGCLFILFMASFSVHWWFPWQWLMSSKYNNKIIKKSKCWRINTFGLRCWRGLLGVPCTARRSNQSILEETNPEYSLERLMLKLKLQWFGHLMWRANSLEKTLMLGKMKGRGEGSDRGWDGGMK